MPPADTSRRNPMASPRVLLGLTFLAAHLAASDATEPARLDSISADQAQHEREQLAAGQLRTFTEAMAEFRKTAEVVKYQSDGRELPGFIYRPRGEGRHPAVLWNHGS